MHIGVKFFDLNECTKMHRRDYGLGNAEADGILDLRDIGRRTKYVLTGVD